MKLASLPKSRVSLFLRITLIILLTDLVFIYFNYQSARQALDESLQNQNHNYHRGFELMVTMTYRNMLQIATYISQQEELNQLFLAGKNAVAAEGGGAGGEQSAAIRQQLLAKVKTGWDTMTEQFNVRQLHYHLGPGSVSFLRVHKADKFGDRMDDVRYTIVDTNAEQTARTGFETGRVYSGLRGVVPVWTNDPNGNQPIHVGALETGTSFAQLLGIYKESYGASVAVLLNDQHIRDNMWPDRIDDRFGGKSFDCNRYLEASSEPVGTIRTLFSSLDNQPQHCDLGQLHMLSEGSRHFAMQDYPLRDYRGDKNPALANAGVVRIWSDVSHEVDAFWSTVTNNLLLAAGAFVLIELLLWLGFRIENRFKQVQEQATHDGLTQLLNRAAFNEQLTQEIARARRHKTPLSVILCDVDFFKNYNDHYGHIKGDECLINVAKAIHKVCRRASDYVARYGGEEFAIILAGTDLNGAEAVAERIRQQIIDLGIPHEKHQTGQVTISLGIAQLQDPAIENADKQLLSAADQALYQAKRSGRNCACSAPQPFKNAQKAVV